VKPIAREKLRLHSNPPRSEDALLSQLILGDAPSASAGPNPGLQSQANQALGGVIATEINQLLGEALPGLSVGVGASTGAPTGAAGAQGYTATTVSYQINDKLSAQAIYEQGPGGLFGQASGAAGSTGTTANAGVTTGDARTKIGLDWR